MKKNIIFRGKALGFNTIFSCIFLFRVLSMNLDFFFLFWVNLNLKFCAAHVLNPEPIEITEVQFLFFF